MTHRLPVFSIDDSFVLEGIPVQVDQRKVLQCALSLSLPVEIAYHLTCKICALWNLIASAKMSWRRCKFAHHSTSSFITWLVLANIRIHLEHLCWITLNTLDITPMVFFTQILPPLGIENESFPRFLPYLFTHLYITHLWLDQEKLI